MRYTLAMRRMSALTALFLAVVMLLPALACLTPPQMTPAEKACCQSQRGQCAQMPGHRCCTVQVHPEAQVAFAWVQVPALEQASGVALADVVVPARDLRMSRSQDIQASPPIFPGLASTVLRI